MSVKQRTLLTKEASISQFAVVKLKSTASVVIQSLEPHRRPSQVQDTQDIDDRKQVFLNLL